MMNLMRDRSFRLDETLRTSERCFTTRRNAARRNFDDRKFRELLAGRKTVLRAGGMLRGPQHPRYWPTDLDFRLLKYVKYQLAGYRARAFAMQNLSLDFKNLPPLFTGSSFFSREHMQEITIGPDLPWEPRAVVK